MLNAKTKTVKIYQHNDNDKSSLGDDFVGFLAMVLLSPSVVFVVFIVIGINVGINVGIDVVGTAVV